MRLRTVAVIGIVVLAGAVSLADQPKAISLLERSERAETRLGRVSLHEGKYQDLGWGRLDQQRLGNWRGNLNPYLLP